MQVTLYIPEYSIKSGLKVDWEHGFDINVNLTDGIAIISANKEGLVSLAKQLLALAQEEVPVGCHLHLDEYNALREGSCELIIQRE